MLKGNMLIAHGGGPSPVINSSLLGAIREAKRHNEIDRIYGARFGAEGILKGDLIDIGTIPDEKLALLAKTPASALGSCRRKLEEKDYSAVLECLKKFDIRYFFYNGGNDSMDTCSKVYELALSCGYDLRVMGIPKTIDNDLAVTDHCPGYGSAARYAALSALELAQDVAALPIHVVIMELMGRNAGWITAASALFSGKMPCEHLVYLPEIDFDKSQFLAAVQRKLQAGRGLLITVSEGIHYAGGAPLGDLGIVDGFGHKVPGGAAQALCDILRDELGIKARAEKPGLLGRCSTAYFSSTDRDEAEMAGAMAVRWASEGNTGQMVGFSAVRSPYKAEAIAVPLDMVANAERKFPLEWIGDDGSSIRDAFRSYCQPLIGNCDSDFICLR